MLTERKESNTLLRFENVSKMYEYETHSLRELNLTIKRGEFLFICGRTGSGKSTFLRLITKELSPTSGKIFFEGEEITTMKHKDVPFLRRKIGVIRQSEETFLEDRTVSQNLEFVMRATGHKEKTLRERARKALSMVRLEEKADCLPRELSGGERKRAEIARALVNNPHLIIADEPTANLDSALSWDIMSLFEDINQLGVTIVIVTHDKEIVNIMRKRVITFSDGRLLGDVKKGRYGDLL